ncbi:hypothetical protein BGZ76_005413 [Entomortierella beljakovae]|nr:hypothetical protein BGZ76_005413 [Entomortierella beljakovae]
MTVYDFNSDAFQSNSKLLPDPKQAFNSRAYYGNAYSKKRNSILYFGGYTGSLESISQDNVVTEYIPGTGIWQTLKTTGTAPPMRADHCMTSNDDGTIVVIFGGRSSQGNTFLSDLYILDTVRLDWVTGAPGVIRAYVACTIAGDQFLAWGGVDGNDLVAGSGMLIYNLSSNSWVTSYTPPPSYVHDTPTTATKTTVPQGSSTTSPSSVGGESSNAGIIAGGVVGAIAVIAIALLVYRFRFANRRSHRRSSLVNSRESRDGTLELEIADGKEEEITLNNQMLPRKEERNVQLIPLTMGHQQQNQWHQCEQVQSLQGPHGQVEQWQSIGANVFITHGTDTNSSISGSTRAPQQYYPQSTLS